MLSQNEQLADTRQFWRFLALYKKPIIVYTLLGGICALIITAFIPKEYKSYGIVYPPSSTSVENSVEYPNFGYDVEADRLMQILESREIRDSVVNKFDLVKEFDIDKDQADWTDELSKKYYHNIRLERTVSMAVQISARLKDPQLCADVVNYIIYCADAFREKIYKKNIVNAYEQASLEYNIQKNRVDSAERKLVLELQQNNLSSLLMLMSDALISIDVDKLNTANTSTLQAGIGARIIEFKSLYEIMKDARSRMLKIKKTYFNPIPKIYVINAAEPHYKKISPSYIINGSMGLLFSFCIVMAVLLVKNNSEQR